MKSHFQPDLLRCPNVRSQPAGRCLPRHKPQRTGCPSHPWGNRPTRCSPAVPERSHVYVSMSGRDRHALRLPRCEERREFEDRDPNSLACTVPLCSGPAVDRHVIYGEHEPTPRPIAIPSSLFALTTNATNRAPAVCVHISTNHAPTVTLARETSTRSPFTNYHLQLSYCHQTPRTLDGATVG